jgi:hypothetical protein
MDEEGDVPPGIVITGPAFRLHVTGADNCGNVADKECIERCPEPRGCISAITLRNSRGDEKTLYWYEFSGPKVSFEVGGETGQFTVSCSECLEVGDESGTLTVTCIQAGERLEKKCKVPEGRFSGPCP